MSNEPDRVATWIASAKAGDAASLELLLLWNYEQLLHYVRQQLSAQDMRRFDAEDIVQQSHQKVFRAIDRFRGETPAEFSAWNYRICDTTLTDNRRTHNSDKRSGYRKRFTISSGGSDSSISMLWSDLYSNSSSPVASAIDNEEQERLEQVLNHLTTEESELIKLRYFQQHSTQEIANEIGVSVSTVMKRCRAALERIRRLVEKSP